MNGLYGATIAGLISLAKENNMSLTISFYPSNVEENESRIDIDIPCGVDKKKENEE